VTSTPAEDRLPVPRSRVTLLITLAVVAVLVIAFFIFASLYTDWLWFDQLGYLKVLTTQWVASTAMFLIGASRSRSAAARCTRSSTLNSTAISR
jgi:uncharacterized membrane protein (UPF0182 family)